METGENPVRLTRVNDDLNQWGTFGMLPLPVTAEKS
jgi:hypothetical protein